MAKQTGRPMCKLCGHEHWSGEPHVWAKRSASSKPASTSSVSKIPATKKTSGTGERAPSSDRPTSSTAAGTSAPNVKSRKATRSSSPKARRTKSRGRKALTTAPISKSAAPVAAESVAELGQPALASTTEVVAKPDFDRNAYQAAYMRDARAAKKLGVSVADYRKQVKP